MTQIKTRQELIGYYLKGKAKPFFVNDPGQDCLEIISHRGRDSQSSFMVWDNQKHGRSCTDRALVYDSPSDAINRIQSIVQNSELYFIDTATLGIYPLSLEEKFYPVRMEDAELTSRVLTAGKEILKLGHTHSSHPLTVEDIDSHLKYANSGYSLSYLADYNILLPKIRPHIVLLEQFNAVAEQRLSTTPEYEPTYGYYPCVEKNGQIEYLGWLVCDEKETSYQASPRVQSAISFHTASEARAAITHFKTAAAFCATPTPNDRYFVSSRAYIPSAEPLSAEALHATREEEAISVLSPESQALFRPLEQRLGL